ncbi:MAG TPA: lipid II flippase MurJ, partial [Petrotogaceae bacterium]|nr:lipid II flippase MurJ [Petrotogaceae bacterium]
MSELLKHSIIFACATFISRILGLVRDGFFAHYFGTAPEYSVYLLAIGLPFYLRQMFAEGALSSAFIPLFTRKEGKEKQVFLSTAFWLLLIVTIILYDIVLIFSGQISFVLGSGLTPEMRDLMSFLLKITFPFITFISLWAIISGVLNTYNMFFVTAISPALSNIVIILAVVMSGFFIPKILGPTIGFVLGGVLQLVFVLFFLRRTNMRITLDYNRTYTKEILNLFGPAFLGASVSMLNTVIDTSIATWT